MEHAYHLEIEEVFKSLKVDKRGLSKEEVILRRRQSGDNVLAKEKPYSRLRVFFDQFKNPLCYILILAAAVSFLVGEKIDAQVILLAVFINVVIGFIQEDKASNALNKLRLLIEHSAVVIRNNEKKEIPATEITLGDILVLRAGDIVSADARLLEAFDLEVNEASLTGESLPIYKSISPVLEKATLAERHSMVYSGTNILSGRGLALVTAIGQKTEIGKISEMVKKAESGSTPLQKKMEDVSRFLGMAVLFVASILIVVGILKKLDIFEILISAIAVAVAAIPEGLAMAVTVILAIGIKQMVKHKALTRKLLAAETLGSITVICSDKTGTLTEGKMRFEKIIVPGASLSADNFKD